MEDLLHPTSGLFNPTLRFAFTNVTTEDFVSYWDSQPIIIRPGQTVELSHHLAVKLLKEMVDKIMIGDAKLDETNYYKNNPNAIANTYRSPKGSSLGVPAARKVWEDQIIKQLAPDEESPAIVEMRAKLKAELVAAANNEQRVEAIHVPTNINEFANIDNKEEKTSKKPLKLKTV